MNEQTTGEGLPPLSQASIDRIEQAVFDEIASERPPVPLAATRARRRRRGWLTGIGVAAAFAVGVLVTPPILSIVGGAAVTNTADGSAGDVSGMSGGGSVPEHGPLVLDPPTGVADESSANSSNSSNSPDAGTREIVANAQATVQVKDIPGAADAIAELAEKHGGFVESTDIGKALAIDDTTQPVAPDSGYGWVSIRVPSADLTAAIDELDTVGEVLSSSISKQDVTTSAIDLRARVDATKASVQRLTELMEQSGSVSELIEAEVALSDRQAQLESYEQQLTALEDQVAMSSLQVQLTRTAVPTTADPAGFTDGLLAGWNGLVVSLNALVIAAGFILPWLAIAAVVVLLIWLIRRRRHRPAVSTDQE